jgi:hypothetical protein
MGHLIGKSTTSRLTYRLVTKSVPCRLDSTTDLKTLVLSVLLYLTHDSLCTPSLVCGEKNLTAHPDFES